MSSDAVSPRELFAQAASLATAERSAILDAARLIDPRAVEEVESLLRYHDRQSQVLDTPAVGSAPGGLAFAATDEPAPETIANFRIVRLLGTGGMGVVYEAEQDSPRRRVALKLVRAGLLTPGTARRFAQEAQALARVQHPSIAQVYQAGLDQPSGRPFIAMELVDGVTLTEFARAHSLTLERKLSLLATVCDGVDHAHRRGVVHRDLKPANILVTPAGEPKILDFGVARLAQVPGTTVVTGAGQIVGTLTYMSPEQAGGDPSDVDARADVYALGAILFELLTGNPPLEVASLPIHQAIHTITTVEPTRLGVIDRRYRGDIETIVARAIEKDPVHRYAHAADLAADLRRYLADEPIAARPAGTLYQVIKFTRRHRIAVVAVIAVMAALILGVIGTSWQAVRATREAARANSESALAKQSVEFMKRIFESAHPRRAQGRDVTVRQVLDDAAADLKSTPPDSPGLAVFAHGTLAEVYSGLDQKVPAIEHGLTAWNKAVEAFGAESPEALSAACDLGSVYIDFDMWTELRDLMRPTVAASEKRLGPEHETTMLAKNCLAQGLVLPEQLAESEAIQRELVATATRVFGPDHLSTLIYTSNLIFALNETGKADEAAILAASVLERTRRTLGDQHPSTFAAARNLVASLASLGRFDEAIVAAEEFVPAVRRVLGPTHRDTLAFEFNSAICALQSGRYHFASARLRDLQHRVCAASGAADGDALQYAGLTITAYIHSQRYDHAWRDMQALRAFCETSFGADDDRTSQVFTLFYDYHQARGEKLLQAEAAARLAGTPYDVTKNPEMTPTPCKDGTEADPDPTPICLPSA